MYAYIYIYIHIHIDNDINKTYVYIYIYEDPGQDNFVAHVLAERRHHEQQTIEIMRIRLHDRLISNVY